MARDDSPLTPLEEALLLTIHREPGCAVLAIHRSLGGKPWQLRTSPSAIYEAARRLQARGLLVSELSRDSVGARGGRPSMVFMLTPAGTRALAEAAQRVKRRAQRFSRIGAGAGNSRSEGTRGSAAPLHRATPAGATRHRRG